MRKTEITLKSTAAALVIGAVSAFALSAPQRAEAQSTTAQNVVPQPEEVSLQAKIKKIDLATRAVTLEGPTGQKEIVTAGPLVRLNLLKVGDTVNAKYYRSVAFLVNGPSGGNGTPVANDQAAAVLARPAQAPGGVAISVIQITGTVTGIDLSSNSIQLVNPSGGRIYTVDVTDPARQALLGTLNVGDTITAVVSQELAVDITPAKKHFW